MAGIPFPDISKAAQAGALKTLADGTMFTFAMEAELKHESLGRDLVTDFLDSFKQKHPKAVLVSVAPGCDENHTLVVYYEL